MLIDHNNTTIQDTTMLLPPESRTQGFKQTETGAQQSFDNCQSGPEGRADLEGGAHMDQPPRTWKLFFPCVFFTDNHTSIYLEKLARCLLVGSLRASQGLSSAGIRQTETETEMDQFWETASTRVTNAKVRYSKQRGSLY